jgi:[acyl-carrier-protein] S-malonyltransferase
MTASDALVFMFPGQSSRRPDMIEKIVRQWPAGAVFVAQASDILKRDLDRHFRTANSQVFARNRDVQIGVFLANYLYMKRLEGEGITASWSLGLSLGEYNHLVHAGALSFTDALVLLDQRGRLFEAGAPGVMTSVFPIEAEVVEQIIAALGLGTQVVIGLYNTPRQQVLVGDREAVASVVSALEDEVLVQAVEIESNIQMHAPPFAGVAEKLEAVLAETSITAPVLPYVPNVTGVPVINAPPEDIKASLTLHVQRPVLWRASVEAVAQQVPNAHFVEVGPGETLYNLFSRNWMPGRRSKADHGDDLREQFDLRTMSWPPKTSAL